MGRRTSLEPGPGPGRTLRRAAAVVLASSGVALVAAGLEVCQLVARPLSEVASWFGHSGAVSCPVTRPPELWWTAAFMALAGLVLWLPRQRGSRLWRRPFLRLTTRRRVGSMAGTVLMAAGVLLVLAALAGMVLGSPPADLLARWLGFGGRLGWGPSVAVVGGTGLTAIWWGAAEIQHAGRSSEDRLIFLLTVTAGIGLATSVLGDLVGIGWPGFGSRQLGVAIVCVLALVGSYALAHSSGIRRLPLGPTGRLVAGGTTIVLGTWAALTTRLPTVCYGGSSCTGDPLVSPRVALPLAALLLYLLVAQYRRVHELRAAYQDETQFVPISTN